MKKKGFKIRWSSLVFCLFALILVWSAVYHSSSTDLLVAFLDIGQGDAIFIKSPIGHKILLDAGSDKSINQALSPFLPFFSQNIDLLIVSHPHLDHYGGFLDLIKHNSPIAFIESGANVSSLPSAYHNLIDSLKKNNVQIHKLSRGARVVLGGGAYLDILYPLTGQSFTDLNQSSLIARLSYGENSFLFTGDTTHDSEREVVVLDGNNLRSDVLKVSHHGSKTGSWPDFIEAVSPSWAIISAGVDNRYNHPHQEVLNILDEVGAKILGTYDLGNIKMTSDGREIICHNCGY